LALEQAMKALRWIEVYLYSFFILVVRWKKVVDATSRPLYPKAKDPGPTV
jgi:hypothetical protein